jgi:hypothetical protein
MNPGLDGQGWKCRRKRLLYKGVRYDNSRWVVRSRVQESVG